MTDGQFLVGGLAAVALVYLLFGLSAALPAARRLQRRLRPDGRAAMVLSFLTGSLLGKVLAVLFWPVLVGLIRLGFLLGWWDWRGEPS